MNFKNLRNIFGGALVVIGAVLPFGIIAGNHIYQKDFVRFEKDYSCPVVTEGFRNFPQLPVRLYSKESGFLESIGDVNLKDLEVLPATKSVDPYVHVTFDGFGQVKHATVYMPRNKSLETYCGVKR